MKNTKYFYISWVIALVAMLGSLYFSEIMHYVPCGKCWYQRILMYPLVIIAGFAAFTNAYHYKYLIMTFSVIGFCISVIHYMEQKIPGFAPIKPCVGGVPCSTQYVNYFGFITIPFLAGTAFLLITVMMLLVRKSNADAK